MEVAAPEVAGVVTAAILIGACFIAAVIPSLIFHIASKDSHDEVDVELLGGDPSHWQSNVFTMSPTDAEPLYGIFGEVENYAKKSSIANTHNYTIDWNAERIVWSVDGVEVRTLQQRMSHLLLVRKTQSNVSCRSNER